MRAPASAGKFYQGLLLRAWALGALDNFSSLLDETGGKTECGRPMHMIELLHASAPQYRHFAWGGLVEYGGNYMPIPRPTIMSSRSVGVNPYASVAPVRGGEEPGRLGTAIR